jgi:4-(gamma-glutamylamino)butanal dehydrogenase
LPPDRPERVKYDLLKHVIAHAREWPMGDPLDPVNRVGALVSKAHYDKVCGYMEKGPKIVMGGKHDKGFVEPTILEVSRDARQAKEEIFGPVLSVLTVDSFDEAIALANRTEYGLAASIFTANVKKAIRGARAIRAGTVTVNSFGEGDISTPFGGFKASGFGGRDNGIHAHDQYTQLKTIWVDLADDGDEVV